MLGDVSHREVARHECIGETAECECHQRELHACGGNGDAHQRGVATRGTEHRHDALHDRDEQCEDQCEVADLGDHGWRSLMLDIVIAFFLCAWSIASFAAGGM